ncbi:hypothetical protein K435DRAFT_967784 [Dendrothele bispora CBS 962.96]|uniref:Uncharacterized protein n=1 Tax=Dendrothele bispora (strain CBS 962.96) TaxID=1314807 RepID=A0A4S8LRQ7_DENBC|nr:hypothetical protein K435DRAFT_967784 [Dendrothele bispora CBS 962.96]
MLLLLITHIGIAILFVCWNPRFSCPNQSPDQQGTCRLFNMYILISSWIIPAFLIAYSLGLAVMVYQRSKQVTSDVEKCAVNDGTESILPVMSVRHPSSSSIMFPENRRPSFMEPGAPRLSSSPAAEQYQRHHSSITFPETRRPSLAEPNTPRLPPTPVVKKHQSAPNFSYPVSMRSSHQSSSFPPMSQRGSSSHRSTLTSIGPTPFTTSFPPISQRGSSSHRSTLTSVGSSPLTISPPFPLMPTRPGYSRKSSTLSKPLPNSML